MAAALTVSLSSCFSPWTGEENTLANGAASGEQGYVTVSIGGSNAAEGSSGSAARTILPWDDDGTDSTQLAHTVILCDGPAPDQEQLIPASGMVNFSLVPGEWTIRVEGRLGTELKSIGLTPITVAAGETTKKTVKMGEPVTVTFNYNSGSSVPDEYQYIPKGDKAVKPADPVRDGNEFNYWYEGTNTSAPFEFATLIDTDITLNALWVSKVPTSITLMSGPLTIARGGTGGFIVQVGYSDGTSETTNEVSLIIATPNLAPGTGISNGLLTVGSGETNTTLNIGIRVPGSDNPVLAVNVLVIDNNIPGTNTDTGVPLDYSASNTRAFIRGTRIYEVRQYYLTNPATFTEAAALLTTARGRPHDAESTGHMVGTYLSENTTDGVIFEINDYSSGSNWGVEYRLLQISGGIITDMRVWLSDEMKAEFERVDIVEESDGTYQVTGDIGTASLSYLTYEKRTYPTCGLIEGILTLGDGGIFTLDSFDTASAALVSAFGTAEVDEEYPDAASPTLVELRFWDYSTADPAFPYRGVKRRFELREISGQNVRKFAQWTEYLD